MIKVAQYVIVVFKIHCIIGRLFQQARLHLAQEAHWIMSNLLPQTGIKFSVERTRLGMPAPPQVIRQFIEPADPGRHNRKDRHAAKDFHSL